MVAEKIMNLVRMIENDTECIGRKWALLNKTKHIYVLHRCMHSCTHTEIREGEKQNQTSHCKVILMPHCRFFQLSHLLERHAPYLAAHLEDLGIPPNLYATSWFITLLTDFTVIPMDQVGVLMNVFFTSVAFLWVEIKQLFWFESWTN